MQFLPTGSNTYFTRFWPIFSKICVFSPFLARFITKNYLSLLWETIADSIARIYTVLIYILSLKYHKTPVLLDIEKLRFRSNSYKWMTLLLHKLVHQRSQASLRFCNQWMLCYLDRSCSALLLSALAMY